MEYFKKAGRSAFAKHLRKKKGKWTKSMANGKSRSKSKLDLKKTTLDEIKKLSWSDFQNAHREHVDFISSEFDRTEWK